MASLSMSIQPITNCSASVSTKEIAAACEKQLGLEIDKKKMVLPEPIKACGTTIVPVKLHREVTAKLTVKVQEA